MTKALYDQLDRIEKYNLETKVAEKSTQLKTQVPVLKIGTVSWANLQEEVEKEAEQKFILVMSKKKQPKGKEKVSAETHNLRPETKISKWYVVFNGPLPGIYTDWPTAQKAVHGLPVVHKSYSTELEDQQALAQFRKKEQEDKSKQAASLTIKTYKRQTSLGTSSIEEAQKHGPISYATMTTLPPEKLKPFRST